MNTSDLIPGELYWLESQAVAYRWIWDMAVVTNTSGSSALKRADTKDPCLFVEKKAIYLAGKTDIYYVFLCVQFNSNNILFGGFDEDSVRNITSAKEPRQPF